MTKRPGRNETVDKAVLVVEIRGHWACAFQRAPEAQRLLCEELERAIPGIMHHLKNYEDFDAPYHVMILTKEGTTLTE